jgi:hypothetical protein
VPNRLLSLLTPSRLQHQHDRRTTAPPPAATVASSTTRESPRFSSAQPPPPSAPKPATCSPSPARTCFIGATPPRASSAVSSFSVRPNSASSGSGSSATQDLRRVEGKTPTLAARIRGSSARGRRSRPCRRSGAHGNRGTKVARPPASRSLSRSCRSAYRLKSRMTEFDSTHAR